MLDVIRRFGHIHRLAASAALRLAVRCSLLIHALCPHTVWADAGCMSLEQTYTVPMPASITVQPGAPVGTLLTEWVSTTATTGYFICSNSTHQGATGTAFAPVALTKAGINVSSPHDIYTVWNTNVPGVGVAIGVRPYVNGCGWQSFHDLGTPNIFPAPWVGNACNSSSNWLRNGGQIEVALVKTGPIKGGTISGDVRVEAAAAIRQDESTNYTFPQFGRKSFVLASTNINLATCTTMESLEVEMGSAKQSSFTGIGSTTPAQTFELRFSNCPTGLNSVQYEFIPMNAVADAANGVIGLAPYSSASGIGVQIKDSSGKAIKFNTLYTLKNYNSSTGGSYAVPLTANYYQTSARVTPGTAEALLIFTTMYQ
ncbi:putative major fimbrial subunit LpfA [Burkholderia glumae]|nr:type 1 fimbrial protein [Burkholderia glumae AU6208]QHE13260.1 fimbrial protein [Burkholderia glumae AU6208]QKM56846.1 putative major fimbrial subunit LpfA [Burkholderia glumae]QTP36003.1 putative major fimbrial subunit LpfA [Burkholderia glumae]